ncbi:outer membrane protein [Aestuariivirga sp.]|uniref:outer membrane protein n=1 Tax=Aestuariivirga sp. TaxID=2650926 RepID=UPI0039E35198
MRYFVSLIGAAVVMAAPAAAADYGSSGPGPAPVSDWSAFYAGINGGYGGGRVDLRGTIDGDPASVDVTSSGFMAGGQIGYDWNDPGSGFLIGIVSDLQWAHIDGRLTIHDDDTDANAGQRIDWFGTTRLRSGFVFNDQVLVYATGGLAYAHTKTNLDDGTDNFSKSNTGMGWTAGAGLEYALSDSVTVFGEYLYVKMQSQDVYEDADMDITSKNHFHVARAGMNFRF